MAEKRGPWKIKRKNIVYKTGWFEVRKDDVTRPDGLSGTYSFIKARHGISVLPIDENGYVHLVREFKYALGKNCINAVSGGMNKNESPLHAAKRELREELGIIAEKWKYLGAINPFTSFVFCRGHLFLAQKLKFTEPENSAVEILKPVKVKFEEAVDMVLKNKITHAPSIVLILKAKEYLSSRNRI